MNKLSDKLSEKIQSIRDTMQVSYIKPKIEVVDKYCQDLNNNESAMEYLTLTRNLTPETILNFRLGYCVERNSISIPIFKKGEVINIKYRSLDINAEAKYTQEKGCEVWLFNEDGIIKGQSKGGVLIVEGEFDCMSAWQSGFKNVVSPASGKDSYGVWLELLDTIPKVFISYDNDKAGKGASLKLAERIGTEKSFEVLYPDGIKDANDYFKIYTKEEYRELIKNARPYYRYKFAGIKDVIDSIREKKENILKLKCIPFVEIEEDWLIVVSGLSNIGKTTWAMNIADELVNKNIPCLILPIERGIRTVGKRYLQTRYNKTQEELNYLNDEEWSKIIPDILELPLYFSMPTKIEAMETVIKAKRLFNTKVVIVDHLDLLVRKADTGNKNEATADFLQQCKQIAQEYEIIFILIHHIKKSEGVGTVKRKPRMEDLSGTASLYQDPEAVIMLSSPEEDLTKIEIDIVKNKGTMGSKIFHFNVSTGKIGDELNKEESRTKAQKSLDEF